MAAARKGQHARSGGFHKVGFEGGQMPLQRRLPKVGFRSHMARLTAELRLHELALPTAEVIDMAVLKAANLVPAFVTKVKVIKSGEITKAVQAQGSRCYQRCARGHREGRRQHRRLRLYRKDSGKEVPTKSGRYREGSEQTGRSQSLASCS